jgi:hypothetical protein
MSLLCGVPNWTLMRSYRASNDLSCRPFLPYYSKAPVVIRQLISGIELSRVFVTLRWKCLQSPKSWWKLELYFFAILCSQTEISPKIKSERSIA